MDKIKLAVAALLVLAGAVGFYRFQSPAYGAISVLAGLIVGAALAYFTAPGKAFVVFAKESWRELQKVVWPTRKEAVQTTLVIFAFTVVMAIFLWTADKTVEWLIYDLLLGWKR